jgi:hypothetical protein
MKRRYTLAPEAARRPESKPLEIVSVLHGSRDVAGILSERQ